MPTTKAKNTIYRMLLPFCSPGCRRNDVTEISGHHLNCSREYTRLLRRHHVVGSATLISDGRQNAVILSSSGNPVHIAKMNTFFRVASITKTATSSLTMRLVDLGLLELDRPVTEYLPVNGAESGLEGVTLRHLLSHTSGLSDPPDLERFLEKGKPFPEITFQAMRHRPGEVFHYSNLGFGLIGCIMESVMNMPLGNIFKTYLFEPLHMNATLEGCLLPREQIMPVTRILPYRRGNDLILTPLGSKPLVSPDPLRHYGHTAGSMYTDISSLQLLFNMLISNENHFLTQESLSEMKKQHASYGKISPTLSYGLGLLMIRDPYLSDSLILGHQGFAYGCADGAFWESDNGRLMITLNGGCSEARTGRLGNANREFSRWAFRKELVSW